MKDELLRELRTHYGEAGKQAAARIERAEEVMLEAERLVRVINEQIFPNTFLRASGKKITDMLGEYREAKQSDN